MLDVALARHANQDLHKLRGVKRLRYHDKLIANAMAIELMEAEFQPKDVLNILASGGPGRHSDTHD